MSKVCIYDTTKETLHTIIENIFNDFPFVLEGKKVLVKPNMLGPFEPERGVTTNPAVLEAITAYLIQRGADVTVGDNPGGQGGGVLNTAKTCGLFQASHGKFRNISTSCRIHPLNSRFIKRISVSDAFFDSDIVINVPRFKTHGYAGISGGIKNMFGIVVGPGKAKLHFKTPNPDDFHELLVDLFQVRIPELTIMDGIFAMEGMGPTTGKLRSLNKILSSTDTIALDSVMARMMGFDVEMIKHITIAAERGLGKYREDELEIKGDASVIDGFQLPESYSKDIKATAPAMNGVIDLYKIGTSIPNFSKQEKCERCEICARSCPANAIKMSPYPVIDHKNCISCFCCAELCTKECFDYLNGGDVFKNLFSRLSEGIGIKQN